MHTTNDRYREAGMPPPRDVEVALPASKATRKRASRRLADAARAQGVPVEVAPGAATKPPLAERVNDPAADVPAPTTDADTEEQS